DVIVSWLPLYHDMGLVACLMQAVYWTIPLVIASPFDWLKAPEWLFQSVEKHKGTLVWLPNFAFNLLTDRVSVDDFTENSLRSLRMVISCSEPVIHDSITAFNKKFSAIGLAPTAVSSSYAMAENVF